MTTVRDLQERACRCAEAHGWWDDPPNEATSIALMHSELSEALEAIRKPPETQHVPGLDPVAEEMADVVIRVLDYCAHHGIDLQDAILRKMEFNELREYKHGGKAF